MRPDLGPHPERLPTSAPATGIRKRSPAPCRSHTGKRCGQIVGRLEAMDDHARGGSGRGAAD